MLIYALKNLHSKRQFCFRNTMLNISYRFASLYSFKFGAQNAQSLIGGNSRADTL